ADEINRTPAKTQAALLEAMEEKQVTIQGKTYPLSEVFFVVATQNPIEFVGTYPLPEAQQDRFLFKLYINFTSFEEEKNVLHQVIENKSYMTPLSSVMNIDELLAIKEDISRVTVGENVMDY